MTMYACISFVFALKQIIQKEVKNIKSLFDPSAHRHRVCVLSGFVFKGYAGHSKQNILSERPMGKHANLSTCFLMVFGVMPFCPPSFYNSQLEAAWFLCGNYD